LFLGGDGEGRGGEGGEWGGVRRGLRWGGEGVGVEEEAEAR